MTDRPCLHCALMDAILAHYRENGLPSDPTRKNEVHGPELLAALGCVAASVLASAPESHHDRLMDFFVQALNAGQKAAAEQHTGPVH